MIKTQVALPQNSYEIWIGRGLPDAMAAWITGLGYRQLALVCDETVWTLHGDKMLRALTQAAVDFTLIPVPPGEESKSLQGLEEIYRRFAEMNLDRHGLVMAFGGGVVGDLAGFAAATWMRGVDYIQVPTTLLAQVDSSVGGKTAVNLPAGKNLVGAFYQPRLVVADTLMLETLPPRELRCGMAEMIKYGAIFFQKLFEDLSVSIDIGGLPPLIKACCELKSRTVQADERDTGQRMLLNFGHSFGHAVEKLGGYARHNHGEAVAIGMVIAAKFGELSGFTRPGCSTQLRDTLATQGLPTECPYPARQLFEAMALDKKGRDGGLELILLRDIGHAEIAWHPMAQIQTLLMEVL